MSPGLGYFRDITWKAQPVAHEEATSRVSDSRGGWLCETSQLETCQVNNPDGAMCPQISAAASSVPQSSRGTTLMGCGVATPPGNKEMETLTLL